MHPHDFFSLIDKWFGNIGLEGNLLIFLRNTLIIVFVLLVSYLADWITKNILYVVLKKYIEKSQSVWDDILLEKKVFKRLAHFAPALVIFFSIKYTLLDFPKLTAFLHSGVYSYMIILSMLVIDSFLNGVHDIYQTLTFAKERPIKGYIQTVKIIIYFIAGILVLSVLLHKNPGYFIGGLGAMAAVLMLVFKDSILGFVASIQLSANNMIKIGDAIEMPKYGAEGEVVEISLTSIKVLNSDRTFTTLPPYALVSDSFKNWRGVKDNNGRRIKKIIYIDINSIDFCSDTLLKNISDIKELEAYIKTIENINTRTNLELFRIFIVQLLKKHNRINTNLTYTVRTLDPVATGYPLEIIAYTNEPDFVLHENIQSEIMEQIIASAKKFNLFLFQNPSGKDVSK